jgi:hypothetical protein
MPTRRIGYRDCGSRLAPATLITAPLIADVSLTVPNNGACDLRIFRGRINRCLESEIYRVQGKFGDKARSSVGM